jgi:hypothetical protein
MQSTIENDKKIAGTGCSPKRHASAVEFTKPEPSTNTGVWPKWMPDRGVAAETCTVGWYSNQPAEAETSARFAEATTGTSMGYCIAEAASGYSAGVTHSMTYGLRHTAATGKTLPKPHARSTESTKPEPDTSTSVPPPSGPDDGKTLATERA